MTVILMLIIVLLFIIRISQIFSVDESTYKPCNMISQAISEEESCLKALLSKDNGTYAKLSRRIIAEGTFTKSSEDKPADKNRTECDNFFTGLKLMPLTGDCALHWRIITDFTAKGGVFHLGDYDSTPYFPFFKPTGKVDYIIF